MPTRSSFGSFSARLQAEMCSFVFFVNHGYPCAKLNIWPLGEYGCVNNLDIADLSFEIADARVDFAKALFAANIVFISERSPRSAA